MQYLGLIMPFKNVMGTNLGVLHIEFGLLERETISGSYKLALNGKGNVKFSKLNNFKTFTDSKILNWILHTKGTPLRTVHWKFIKLLFSLNV